MPEQGERKYYLKGFNGRYREINSLAELEEKGLPIKHILSTQGAVSISLELSKVPGQTKRELGLYQGKRKAKHFYRK